ncbi:MAG: hypothetical protein K1X29_10550 [Bdellovibrionales bacterium]|nr:hypothetical protein [Bdellovibrionales bacterium]
MKSLFSFLILLTKSFLLRRFFKISKFFCSLFIIYLFHLTLPSAYAFYATMDAGQILKPGHYKISAETQAVTEGNNGMNLAARFEGPINDELTWKAQLGFGTTNIFGGGFVKWVPIPDLDSQPAIGLIAGVVMAHADHDFNSRGTNTSDFNELSVRAHPFVSKHFDCDLGEITPYASLPVGIRSAGGDSSLPIQLTVGADFKPNTWKNMSIVTEIGVNVARAFSYLAVGVTLEFDEENGIVFK